MNTISFSNAFKSLMATLGAKTTDSNYAVPLVNKTSGAPQGFMNMSSLASVLGETVQSIPANTDLNDLKRPSVYRCNNQDVCSTLINSPFSNSHFYLEVLYVGPNLIQRLTSGTCTAIYLRRYKDSSENWMNWYKFTGMEIVPSA